MFLSETGDRLSNNPGALIFFSIIIILVTAGLAYLMFLLVKREAKKFRDEKATYIEGLSTKSEFLAEITTYIAKKSEISEFALMSINLDKFSNFINAFGDEEAEQILQKIALNILDQLPPRVVLSRFYEDQFYIFVKGGYDRGEVQELATILLETIRKPIKLYGESNVNVTASMGVAFYPNHGRNTKELMESLNMAQYISKRDGGDRYTVYSREVGTNESQNYDYYHQIKSAMKNKEFALYYQPIINCKTNTLYGVEGLLRWNHPEHGVLSPFKFINIMEQSGDIIWVGEWGIEVLVSKYVELRNKFPELDLIFSMNLSPKQLASPTIANDFQKVMRKYRVPPKKITLEIEEFALFEKLDVIKKNISLLAELGFGIAVDGFGLDYAALSKLEEMPIDIVKLDNDFINHETDTYLKEKFATVLVGFAEQNKKTIICEGIENQDMLSRAIDRNISIVQGYYFSKPISSDELDKYIKVKSWEPILYGETSEETPAEEVKEEIPTEEVKEETIAEEVKEETPAEEVKEETPAEEVKEETPAEEVKEETLAEEVNEETPAEEVKEETPAEEVKEEKEATTPKKTTTQAKKTTTQAKKTTTQSKGTSTKKTSTSKKATKK